MAAKPGNQINPNKLRLSKWTAVAPQQREKHFIVTELLEHEDGTVWGCVLEAVINKRQQHLSWHELKDAERWLPGWR